MVRSVNLNIYEPHPYVPAKLMKLWRMNPFFTLEQVMELDNSRRIAEREREEEHLRNCPDSPSEHMGMKIC